tara:strand:- start:4074 stop:4760 length:687 start_codon:yes stop_codon:yes gene_type:complete
MSLLDKNKKVLIVSPHPDDEIIGCGGLIAECKRKNIKVTVLYICTGSTRQLVTGSTNSKTRMNEIKNVAKYGNFDFKIIFKNKYFVKLDSIPQKNIIDKLEDIIEAETPNIVMIPFGNSYNQDHRATFTACITAMRPTPKNTRHFVNTVMIYEEPYSWATNDLFKPNFYLNTEKVENDKVKMMELHTSQNRLSPFPRSKENLIARMRIRGSEIGVGSAEAYQLIRGII